MIICTTQAATLQPNNDFVYHTDRLNDLISFIQTKKTKKVYIYDKTQIPQKKDLAIFPVNDHINKTGSNPLIGKQKELSIDFIDIKNLYKQTNKGIITHCCGSELNASLKYPSYYLCHISILCKALGINLISAYLINSIQ